MRPPFEWDLFSDQPKVIRDKGYKKRMRMRYLTDYLKMFLTSVVMFPVGLVNMAPGRIVANHPRPRELFGMGVNLDKGEIQYDLIDELGVQHVLIRVPLWDLDNLNAYQAFASEFKRRGRTVLVNILQDREHIENPELLIRDTRKVFNAFSVISNEYQVGNAINRIKWGFFSVEEYLKFYKSIQSLRDSQFPSYQLIGPSVIDFEYHFTIRALFNSHCVKFDRLSALLYVDRMGSPTNKQYQFFDTKRKMRLLGSLGRLSTKVTKSGIYITEVNWPLKNTAPYAPTSETECVSTEDYQRYMLDYYRIAQDSGVISRVYWHQLVAPGYGLVDDRDGLIKKTSAFHALKGMLATS